jgi:hypothetical protein
LYVKVSVSEHTVSVGVWFTHCFEVDEYTVVAIIMIIDGEIMDGPLEE